MSDWWLDELAHAGPEHLDARYVAGYDRKAQTNPAVDVEALRDVGFGSDSTMIDLGAGTGVVAFAAAAECRHVTAVDVSAAMAGHLRMRAAELGLDNVDVVRAGFLTYDHAGPPVDFVYTRNALHQIPDFWKA